MGLYTLNITAFTGKQPCESQFNGFAKHFTYSDKSLNTPSKGS